MSAKKKESSKAKSLPSGDSAQYVSRPRRKPDSSVKGKLNKWEGSDYCEFVPTGSRESNRKVFKQLGGSSFYKSKGTKESSYSIHVNVDGESVDPIGEAFSIFKVLTEGQRKTEPKLPEGEGRMLYEDSQGLKVWLNTENGKLSILAELDCNQNIERMLLQAQATMNVTIGRHRTEILNNEKKTTD